LLLSADPASRILNEAGFFHPSRPNTPVLPYGTASGTTFIDPSAQIVHPDRIAISTKSFVGLFATLNGASGFIKIGSNAVIGDNAGLFANPNHQVGTLGILVGNNTIIGFGATVVGPSSIGAFSAGAKPTFVGYNAVIDGATISPGAYVSALARVGPGVTIPAGLEVLPGAGVTTNAEASDPALGKVVPLPAATLAQVSQMLTNNASLANGYTQLYQGNSATGASPGLPSSVTGVNNGDLAQVEGVSPEPGSPTVSFEPARQSPRFPSPFRGLVQANLFSFPARITGQAIFADRAAVVGHRLGKRVAIRADEGQPITFGPIGHIGSFVTIHSPLGGSISFAGNDTIGDHVVIVGGPSATTTFGNNVTVGSGSVVARSKVGDGASIGAAAYVADSTVAAGTFIPDGTILIHDIFVGTVQA
jgi:carbonic anhydrase/acetyltransferase-like protein (isoleucine patch superfamily)